MSFFDSAISTVNSGIQLYNSVKSTSSFIKNSGSDFLGISNSDNEECEVVDGMFDKSGLSYDAIKKRLLEEKYQIEQLQHSDVYHFEIIRQMPTYDLEKSKVISSLVSGVEVISNGLSAEEVQVGSGFYNQHELMQSGEIQVTFLESQNGDVGDFLTKIVPTNIVSSGLSTVASSIGRASSAVGMVGGVVSQVNSLMGLNIPTQAIAQLGSILGSLGGAIGGASDSNEIIPTDGTFLLPHDFYFSIKISHFIRVGEQTIEKVMVSGDYILDGNVSYSYATGAEQYLTASATFKPMQSWDN